MPTNPPSRSAATEFEVLIDDNACFMDEPALWLHGTFKSYDAALRAARRLIETSLKECGMGTDPPGEALARYKTYGDDAWIRPTPEGTEPFSGWTFAEELVRQKAAERGA